MGIGYRIKEARENLGFTQIELGKMVGVTGSAITNYENETSHPKEPVMYKLIEVLKVDPNYLFQDCVNLPKESNDVTLSEYEKIKIYRYIKEHSPDGLKMVDAILNREYTVAVQMQEQKDYIKKLEKQASVIIDVTDEARTPERVIQYFRSVSAGSGEVIFDDGYSERISIPDIEKYRRVAYAVKVVGHSMEPRYNDGDILLIEPTCAIEINEIGIFNVDGKAFVKKLGQKELISLNKGYENISFTEYSRCMGRVIDKIGAEEKDGNI